MSNLVVMTYKDETTAKTVLDKLGDLQKRNLITLDDAAVVSKDENGKFRIRQTLEQVVTGTSAVWGGTWGLLLELLFGGPLVMALLGVGLGAVFGRTTDLGVDNSFIKDVSRDLQPGNSALFVMVYDSTPDKVISELSSYGGTLYQTSLSNEAEAALAKALESGSVAEASREALDAELRAVHA